VPTIFMSLMNGVFRKYLDHFVQVFLYDILIYSKNEREHEEHLQVVLSYLRENKLYGKLSKCSLFQKEIHYLGHIIFGEGIFVEPEKVKAIMEWLVLKNAHEVRRFMGLAGYYQKFLEGFSKIAKPITTLQCKGVRYEWREECDSAFIELKRLLTSVPILQVLDMEKDFTVYMDASKQGFNRANAGWRSDRLCIKEVEETKKSLRYSWFRVGSCNSSSETLEALSCGVKL
jgi:hypothetical protein